MVELVLLGVLKLVVLFFLPGYAAQRVVLEDDDPLVVAILALLLSLPITITIAFLLSYVFRLPIASPVIPLVVGMVCAGLLLIGKNKPKAYSLHAYRRRQ
ncbi:MAG TPA: hypothetical protein VK983_00290 [Candidatus Limnocylindrales bacterium]|nr:hypothetical protein [Candidatus Limnocylindrales bacterium]